MTLKRITVFLTSIILLSLLLPSLVFAGSFDSRFADILKESAIAEMQQRLQEKGYYHGNLDGNLSSLKDDAINQVKEKAGIPPEIKDLPSMAQTTGNQLLEKSKNTVLQQVTKKVQIDYLQKNYPHTTTAGQAITVQLTVKNTSKMTWMRYGQFFSYFTYSWLDSNGNKVSNEGKIFLPKEVKPGETFAFNIQTLAPSGAGKYNLQVNFVMLDSPWSKVMGLAPLNLPIELTIIPSSDLLSTPETSGVDTGVSAASYLISGRGFGHGVGLSQWGARGMALQNFNYQDIIKYYYTGTSVQAYPSSNATVRVGIWLGQPKATITTTDAYQIIDKTTQTVLASGQAGDIWQIQASSNGLEAIALNNVFLQPIKAQSVLFQALANSKFTLTDKQTTYRGSLQVNSNLKGTLDVINFVNMEDYLYGVVAKESPTDWPLEALKAQAVVARSYALYKVQNRVSQSFDLYDSTTSQVYAGVNGEKPEALQAVMSTAGQVATYNGQVIEALFYANSGGYTENNENYWKGVAPVPYLRAVADPYSGYQADPLQSRFGVWWQQIFSRETIETAFNANSNNYIGSLISLEVIEKYPSGRPAVIKIIGTAATKNLTRTEFMNILDPKNIYFKSSWFEIKKQS